VFDEELENDGAELKNQTMSARKRAEGEDANEEYATHDTHDTHTTHSIHLPAKYSRASSTTSDWFSPTYSKPIEIITTLWEKIKGSENESTFLSIMHTLLHLGLSLDGGSQDPTLSKKVWGIIDKLLRQFDLMGNGTTLLRSSL